MNAKAMTKSIVLGYLSLTIILLAFLSATYQAPLPIFIAAMLLCAITVLVKTDCAYLGLRAVARKQFLSAWAVCMIGICLPLLVIEPFTKSYTRIIEQILQMPTIDLMFLGLRISGIKGPLLTVLCFAGIGFVAEEIFFRGLLIQSLKKRFKRGIIFVQAGAFLLLNMPVVFIASALDSVVYIICYTLPLSLSLGWAAYQTGSILPGYCALTIANLFYFVFLRSHLLPL